MIIAPLLHNPQNKQVTRYQGASMNAFAIPVFGFLRAVFSREDGQDLVEYGLIMAMITFGTVSGMGFLANGINVTFSAVGTVLTSNV
jgi:Flp pilus assembly pilin Flp